MASQAPGDMTALFDVWLVAHAATRYADDALSGSGLTGDDFGLYSLLHLCGPTTPTQISRWTGMRSTTVSAALKRLERRGHATRTQNPDDARSHRVGLSAAGIDAHASAAPSFLAAMDALAQELGGDHDRVRSVLARVDDALRAVLGIDDRPYRVNTPPGAPNTLTYEGTRLTPRQAADVRAYIDFVRSRTP